MIPLFLILIAAIAYFLGSLNGALLLSKYVFHKDIRKYGSGNAGYTNFVRTFGRKWGWAVFGIDVLKSIIAVLIGALLMSIPGDGFPVIGKLFAGFCTVLGHVYPVQNKFRGGKGVICMMVALWLTDWRVGMLATAVLVAVLAVWQYVSLASLCACFTGVLATWIFIGAEQMKGLAGVLALFSFLVILWRHRGNVIRLLGKKEPRVRWGRRPESRLRDDKF